MKRRRGECNTAGAKEQKPVQSSTPSTVYISRIVWSVPSATRPGVVHEVTADGPDDVPACHCEASQHPKTEGKCWHLRAIRSGLIRPRCRASVIAPASAERTCGCGMALTHRDGYGDIVAAHCRICHVTARAGDPCSCMEDAGDFGFAGPDDRSW
jgi:hypothetical protein